MLSDRELESLLKGGKSDRLERKGSLRDKVSHPASGGEMDFNRIKEIRKAVCAFARSARSEASGVVFVTVHRPGLSRPPLEGT